MISNKLNSNNNFFITIIFIISLLFLYVGLIHDLVKRRLDLYNETTDVKDIEQPEELFKEIESITIESDKKIEADQHKTDS